MKKIAGSKICLILLVISFIAISGCKKNKQKPIPEEEEIIAKVYDRGTVDGTATQQMIGPAGGTITTSDSRISITVPAGTVNSDVMFSIQPITSTLPLSAGKTYRLLPENVTFAKPVTITFKYDATTFEGSSVSTAYLAFQNKEGYWQMMPNTILNETNKTLSVESTHFSDWGIIEQIKLVADKSTVSVNESTNLKLTHVQVATEDLLANLVDVYLDDEDVSYWKILEGGGTLTPVNPAARIFKAPSSVPSINPTVVEVALKNLPIKHKRANAQLTLRAPIQITNGTYMQGKYDGNPFYMSEVVITNQLGTIWIQGVNSAGKSILMLINGNAQGAFSFGKITDAGKAEIRCGLTDDVFDSYYKECAIPPAQTETKYSGGSIVLLDFPGQGEYMKGTFDATVYDVVNCNVISKKLTGEFRAIKGF